MAIGEFKFELDCSLAFQCFPIRSASSGPTLGARCRDFRTKTIVSRGHEVLLEFFLKHVRLQKRDIT